MVVLVDCLGEDDEPDLPPQADRPMLLATIAASVSMAVRDILLIDGAGIDAGAHIVAGVRGGPPYQALACPPAGAG